RPRAPEQGQLVLGREEGAASAGAADPGEDGGDVAAGGLLHGGVPVSVVPGDAVAALRRADAPPGDHAGVIGEGEGLLDLGAGVAGARALPQQPEQVGQLAAAEPAQRADVEPVDRDREDLAVVDPRYGLAGRRPRGGDGGYG